MIGTPVAHSLSPAIHNAAFDALDLDWAYVALDVPDGRGADAVVAARVLGLAGLSVTMPHKHAVLDALDVVSPTAATLKSVNAIYWRGTKLAGESTDGDGFLDALRHDEGFDPSGCRCVVFGAGGAARAVVLALAGAGAADVAVVNRTPIAGSDTAALAGVVGRTGSADVDVPAAELVVNATPLGMAGVHEGEVPFDAGLLRSGQLVVDLVYHPVRTPLLEAARAQGCVAVTGLGMLIHQAAHAFRLWTAEDPPLEVMSAAALAALSSS